MGNTYTGATADGRGAAIKFGLPISGMVRQYTALDLDRPPKG